jgi:hypothetical protein
VYANAFPPTPKDAKANATLDEIRADLTPQNYLGWAERWVGKGAGIVAVAAASRRNISLRWRRGWADSLSCQQVL